MENKELEALKEKYADFIASLSDEDKAKVEACKTVEELTELAQNAEGALPDEIVEAVAGGKGGCSHNWVCVASSGEGQMFRCHDCGAIRKQRFL
ncbi:MAG: hypothetical protein IK093_05610 [Ruminiclostridium sp.]|nr:hypothetical protein [Ruminiclostridium sp.]